MDLCSRYGPISGCNFGLASDLAEFLKAHSLEKRISIILNPAGKEDFIEFTHPSGRGTISVPLRLISEQEIETSEPSSRDGASISIKMGLLSERE